MAGEVLPPLMIFSSDAQTEDRMAVNDEWIAGFGKVRGKYGHRHIIERLPYIASRPNGSMDVNLFVQLICEITFDLYPEATVSLEIVTDEFGHLFSGPV